MKEKVEMIVCARCSREYIYIRGKGHGRTLCNSCVTNAKRARRKKKCVDYKGGKCWKCGYDKCIEALEFHHMSSGKLFNISGNHCLSWEKVRKELDKTMLVCANCHREIKYAAVA